MIDLIKNEKEFTVLFFGMLMLDIIVKQYCPAFPYRYISRVPIILMLFFYYYFNNKERNKKKHLWIILALLMFFIGDILIINPTKIVFLGASLFFFSLGKIFLSFRFSHKFDFNISRLIPFSIAMFIYTVCIVSFLFNSLKVFFVPALISFFISLLLFQFAFLRKDAVNKISYIYVCIGVILYIISESMMAIKIFRTDIPLQDFLIMLLYGMALYCITIGIVKEQKRKIIINPF
ncbi:lysoplasmalogenase family protein [Mariniflexile litorale]|uniref:Lysoplasmalogenase family protein n=1 Tax=Mariniflexile litorale TaxID=3045158 RepID=A0AAU7EGY5_9FLAO|nr:lysoplasmalogenase family protein [Mariniflexile sp. KMM 9835]MDQ8210753.1 lysoplasmalogenase family protein [Mariniflexile sp. KMM 9835]